MSFSFMTYLVYSPRGNSEKAIQSKKLLGGFKNGVPALSVQLSDYLLEENTNFFDDSILVPVPRSAPIVEGGVFPSKIIADIMVQKGLSNGVVVCLNRTTSIPKSSNQYTAETRNSVETHMNSLSVVPELVAEQNIILVDDVLTLGRTTMACALKLKEAFPDKTIKIFCVFRTRSFIDTNKLISLEINEMILSNNGKVMLPD